MNKGLRSSKIELKSAHSLTAKFHRYIHLRSEQFQDRVNSVFSVGLPAHQPCIKLNALTLVDGLKANHTKLDHVVRTYGQKALENVP